MNGFLLIALVIGPLLGAGPLQQGNPMKDREKIQGTWEVVDAEEDGKSAGEEFRDTRSVLTFGKETWEVGFQDPHIDSTDTMPKSWSFSYKLNSSAQPAEIDLITWDGKNNNLIKGIYSLEGDKLKVCWANTGSTRPSSFQTKAGSGRLFMILKRQRR